MKQIAFENGYGFDRWNTSSIEYLFGGMRNTADIAVQNEAKNIFDIFMAWHRENKEDGYMPEFGMERMYPINVMMEARILMDFQN